MKIKGIVKTELDTALSRINGAYYWNLKVVECRDVPRGVQFGLRVYDSRAFGARLASSGKRHTPSASWEAHRDLFREVFKINPAAVVITMVATYRGSADFEEKFPATANHMMGSRAEPVTLRELSIHP
jgi:hypothetical protein